MTTRYEQANWPEGQTVKRKKPPTGPKRVLVTARVDFWARQELSRIALEDTASRWGYQPVVNAAICYWVKPESYVCIVGTDDQGIIAVTHHLTELLANQARCQRRIVWSRHEDGVWYGKLQDGNRGGAWCQITKVSLEKK